MEAVAAIASVAGIVSLVGQTLEGIIKLRGFYQDCSEASNSIGRFLKALNGLIQIHEDVRDLVKKLEDSATVEANKSILASLQIQIDDCGKDVGIWLEKASGCQPTTGSGTRASFRKFLAALEKKKIADIYQEIETHKNNISTKLSVIGRHMDIDQSVVLDKISTKIDQVAESQNLYNADPTTNWDINKGFGSRPASLSSIAGSLNRIEHALGSRHGSFGSPASHGPASPYTYNEADNNNPLFPTAHQTPDRYVPYLLDADSILPFLAGTHQCHFAACGRHFPSASALRCHESEEHDMHWEDGSPFLCAYESCEKALPGNSFPRYSDLRHHMKRMHNDFKPPKILTKESDFKDLDVLFVEKLGSCLSSQMNIYIRLILVRAMMKLSHEALPTLRCLFSEKTEKDESFDDIEQLSIKIAQRLRNDINEIREACWKDGQNVDDVDIILKVREGFSSITPYEPPQQRQTEDEIEGPVPQERPERQRIKLGASKMDRINLWLLENLLASPNETMHHRSYLPENLYEDSQEWARAVLKYWLLDGAAVEQRDQTISTNGAVDSAGRCHSARVVFEKHLPFPIVEQEIGAPPEAAVQGNSAKETLIIDGVEDRMSWTSGHSARSLAHRQKRRKREHSG